MNELIQKLNRIEELINELNKEIGSMSFRLSEAGEAIGALRNIHCYIDEAIAEYGMGIIKNAFDNDFEEFKEDENKDLIIDAFVDLDNNDEEAEFIVHYEDKINEINKKIKEIKEIEYM